MKHLFLKVCAIGYVIISIIVADFNPLAWPFEYRLYGTVITVIAAMAAWFWFDLDDYTEPYED